MFVNKVGVILALVLCACHGLKVPRHPSREALSSQEPKFTRYSVVVAKKGKPNVPVHMRGAMNQREQMREYMEQQEQMKNSEDGLPVFNIFVRSKKAGIWYPCGSMKGDQASQALVNAYQGKFMRNMYKGQLDKGVARSTLHRESKPQASP
uniref:Uncharacterized protein n=1 Tax=Phaeomonas parva TaxID=124430 RepID=A0A7S1UEU0_9STRA|mmetsp:Transcript_44057/g.138439  ORF Transcript_44057/g.138439 Transcript_44057/m.138439 type:complete len:151 (+) Transcript_44057:52-504(+)